MFSGMELVLFWVVWVFVGIDLSGMVDCGCDLL